MTAVAKTKTKNSFTAAIIDKHEKDLSLQMNSMKQKTQNKNRCDYPHSVYKEYKVVNSDFRRLRDGKLFFFSFVFGKCFLFLICQCHLFCMKPNFPWIGFPKLLFRSQFSALGRLQFRVAWSLKRYLSRYCNLRNRNRKKNNMFFFSRMNVGHMKKCANFPQMLNGFCHFGLK